MPRKPSDTIAFKLRIRESLRRKLEVAAERNNTSINAEIANRLARSFETEAVRSLDEIANSLTLVCKQFGPLVESRVLVAPSLAGNLPEQGEMCHGVSVMTEEVRSITSAHHEAAQFKNNVRHLVLTQPGQTSECFALKAKLLQVIETSPGVSQPAQRPIAVTERQED